MSDFAKLFDTPHGQLLVFMEDGDDEPVIRVIGAVYEGVQPSATLSGWPNDEEGQQAAFDSIGQEQANNLASDFRSMLEKLSD